jgi:ribose-phosphate pyrophosphokinase
MRTAGIDHAITVDLHTPQVEGFFHGPLDSLTAVPVLCHAVCERLPPGSVVVAPDAGRVPMATAYARQLGALVVVLHKERHSPTSTVVTHVVGDVRDRPCLLVDDVISTGETIVQSIEALLAAGARREIVVAATHGLLVDGAWNKLDAQSAVTDVFVTDTVAASDTPRPRLHVVSVSHLLADAIRRLSPEQPVS